MSYRLRFMFWLNMDNPDDVEVADIIELLKNDRAYTRAIRDGLRIVWGLRHGDTDTLYALYPELAPGAAVSSFERGWRDVQEGNTYPIDTLFDDDDKE